MVPDHFMAPGTNHPNVSWFSHIQLQFQWCVPLCTQEREHKWNTTWCEEEVLPLITTICINSPALLLLIQTLGWRPTWPHPASREGLVPRAQAAPATFQLPASGWGNGGSAPTRGQLQLPAPAYKKPLSQIAPWQQPIPEYKRWGDHKYLFNKAKKWSRFGL